ncbi:Uncharacterised protein [Mycobacteroides abscessus subsp. abscessus]|nr:Uncharacterised protein [Mycobacteroides abscessus subsp. abscessus]
MLGLIETSYIVNGADSIGLMKSDGLPIGSGCPAAAAELCASTVA